MPRRTTPLPEVAVRSGARVRQQREQTGKSLRAVAKEAGVSFSMLARWERGVYDPPVSHAVAIARVLGLRLDEVVGVQSPAAELCGE
jgi:transcriptional regulator with XRE-family HTH domain